MSQRIHPVYYLIAEDRERMRAFVRDIEHQVFPSEDDRASNIHTYFPDETPSSEIFSQCYQLSMFSPKQIIKVHHAEKIDAKAFKQYLEKVESNTVLILIRTTSPATPKATQDLIKQVNKVGMYKAFLPEENQNLEKVLKTRAGELHLSFSNEAIAYLKETIEHQKHHLDLFFDLLSNLSDLPSPIGADIVSELLGSGRLPSQNEFIQAILTKNFIQAIQKFRTLATEGTGLTTLMNWMYYDLKFIYQMKAGIEGGSPPAEAWSKARPFPYYGKDKPQKVRESEELARLWTFQQLERALNSVLDLEIFLKSSDTALQPLYFETVIKQITTA